MKIEKRAVILGAGITGLSSAYLLAKQGFIVNVFDISDKVGGQARSHFHKGYALDLGPHKLYTENDEVLGFLGDIDGLDLLKVKKKGKILFRKKLYNYPLGPKDIIKSLNIFELFHFMINFIISRLIGLFFSRRKTYKDWFIANFGPSLYCTFIRPSTEKIWGYSDDLSVYLAKNRIRVPNAQELIIEHIFRKKPKRTYDAKYFYYPKKGIGILSLLLKEKIKRMGGNIKLSANLEKIHHDNKTIKGLKYSDGYHSFSQDEALISTIPLKDLFLLLFDGPKEEKTNENATFDDKIDNSLKSLKYRSLILIYLFYDKKELIHCNWIFFPQPKIIFNRIFQQNSCSLLTCPPGKSALCLEITCDFNDKRWKMGDKEIVHLAQAQLLKIFPHIKDKAKDFLIIKKVNAYPIWDKSFVKNLETVEKGLDNFENLYSIGRQGGFIYGGICDCIDMAIKTTQLIIKGENHRQFERIRKDFIDLEVID